MSGSQTALKELDVMQTIRVDDIVFTENDIRDLLKGMADCIQELEQLKSNCWSKKAMRCGCWEQKKDA